MAMRRTRITASVDAERGVFMISVAAELAEMHPQTLRMYEARGLIEPQRSPKGTRLYSHADVERLRRIQALTSDGGMNLAGVEKVFELEAQLERQRRQRRRARAARDRAGGRDRAARGGQALGQGGDRPLRGGLDRPRAGARAQAPGTAESGLRARTCRRHETSRERRRGDGLRRDVGSAASSRWRASAARSRVRRRPAATARLLRRGNRRPRRRARRRRGAAGVCRRREAFASR